MPIPAALWPIHSFPYVQLLLPVAMAFPHLINILEDVLSNPEEYIQDEHLYDHIYAFMLLGHFKAKDAHQVIVDVFSLKDGIPDTLFSDLITEDLPIILLNTCDGSLDRIKSMILDKKVDEYCRHSACRALAYGNRLIPKNLKKMPKWLQSYSKV